MLFERFQFPILSADYLKGYQEGYEAAKTDALNKINALEALSCCSTVTFGGKADERS